MSQLNVKAATDVTFTVVASGGSLLYQWQKNGVDISDTPLKYSGTETDTLTVINVHDPEDEGAYSVVVANTAGSTDTEAGMLTIGKISSSVGCVIEGRVVVELEQPVSYP